MSIAAHRDRERFRAEALPDLQRIISTQSGSQSAATNASISVADLDRTEKELTRYLSPIARILVRREAANARSTAELWRLVSGHIDRDDERRDFLRRLQS